MNQRGFSTSRWAFYSEFLLGKASIIKAPRRNWETLTNQQFKSSFRGHCRVPLKASKKAPKKAQFPNFSIKTSQIQKAPTNSTKKTHK